MEKNALTADLLRWSANCTNRVKLQSQKKWKNLPEGEAKKKKEAELKKDHSV